MSFSARLRAKYFFRCEAAAEAEKVPALSHLFATETCRTTPLTHSEFETNSFSNAKKLRPSRLPSNLLRGDSRGKRDQMNWADPLVRDLR
jgi:hypothetical protein